jgi:two-component system, LuxR family, sensor kinase FixL
MDDPNASPSSAAGNPDQRMADLATFASGVVHDIRNPLNVIRTNVYLLRQRLSEEEPRTQRALERIDDQVTLAMRMLDGIQAIYRSDSPTPQRVQLNQAAQAVAETTTLPEGTTLQLELDQSLPLVTVDPQLLDAAIRALLRNALDALPAGGSIRVSTDQEAGRARIVVQDSGEGVPEEVRARVFEPFFTTRRARSGLGLALVSKVAQAHGGTAEVRSFAGSGTQAILALPIRE